jgi:hypothetical protein
MLHSTLGAATGRDEAVCQAARKSASTVTKKGTTRPTVGHPAGGRKAKAKKGKGKGKGKGKEMETAAATMPKQESEDQAWMVNVQTNIVDFIEEGLNHLGVANNEVVEGGASTEVLLSLTGMIAQHPTTPSADVSATVDLLADFFETPTTPNNNDNDIWLLDDDSMPDLATASDSLDEEDESNGDEVGFETLSDSNNNDNNMPGLQVVLDSEDEGEDGDEIDDFDDFFSDGGDTDKYEIVGLDDKAYTCTFVADTIKKGTSTSLGSKLIDIELYDSGALHHMSGYQHRFINYHTIPPKPITAADKCSFSAIGMGDMYITVPNSDKAPTCVLLKDILYAPSMGVTLVSIS